MSLRSRALGVAAGLLLDRALGEPPDAWHPVAWFGTVMGRVERVLYAETSTRLDHRALDHRALDHRALDHRVAGGVYALVGFGLGPGAGLVLRGAWSLTARMGPSWCRVPTSTPADVALAVAVASAGRMLRRTSTEIESLLLAGDLEGARDKLPWLVGRDPSGLDESGVAAAVVESLAENTVDAVVAPAFWGLVAGASGVLAHRAANTMDAMVGHRSERYARFGTAAARLDDGMAWVPARIFAGIVAGLAGLADAHGVAPGGEPAGRTPWPAQAGGTTYLVRAERVVSTVRRDAPAHPSPNAGVAESAVAGALGVELGGPLRYGERVEERPRLGTGPRPDARTITAGRALVDRAELVLVGACLALALLGRTGRRKTPARPMR